VSPRTYAASVLAIVCTIGCNHPRQSTQGSTQTGGSPVAPSTPAAPAPAPSGPTPSPDHIPVNETHHGTLTESLPTCTFEILGSGGWGGLCQTFSITANSSGVLTATLRWAADAPLVLFFKTAAGEQIDMACCAPGLSLRMPVEMGATYRIDVAYTGRPPGYPHIAPVDYTLDTTLVAGNAGSLGSVKARIFADEHGSLRIANAKLEVTDGPNAGAVAAFDPTNGLFEISGLPAGFVQVTASADGFVSLTRRVPVGLDVPEEFVLSRLTPLPQATNRLWGWVSFQGSSACGCVKLEILDGPLAGTFTFSDPDMGWYTISGVPSGLIHVRASAPSLQSQTLSVVVQGDTELDFVMIRVKLLNFQLGFRCCGQFTRTVIGESETGVFTRNR
jgi:hypothetical protein